MPTFPADRPQPDPLPHAPIPLRPGDEGRARPTTPPRPLTSFVGREHEVAIVRGLLGAKGARLVVLTGPGGVGKTRLALRVAEGMESEFPDGVWFVPLASVRDPFLVASAIAQSLGLRETGDRPVAEVVAGFLGERRALLVLDNFEHVLDAAPLVPGLLVTCPSLRVLVTSRAVLRVSGEHDVQVPPLALPPTRREVRGEGREDDVGTSGSHASPLPPAADLAPLASSEAVRLFVERAAAAQAGFALTPENAPAVAAVCRRLEGLPLAIELAAARVAVFAPAALLGRLERRLPLLTGGPRDAPSRLQTMRGAIAWSYELLAPEEQALFRRLAVFTGGWTLEAAEYVGGGGGESVLDGLASLVEKSLVRALDATGPGGDELRFGFLETIREFALERLEASGEAAATRERHARWYAALAQRALTFPLRGAVHPDTYDRLEADLGNLRAALGWLEQTGDAAALLGMAVVLGPFWLGRSYRVEGRRWLERGLAMAGDDGVPTAVRAQALHCAAALARTQHDDGRAIELAEAALVLCRDLGDTGGTATVLNLLGTLARRREDYDRAAVLFDEALALFRALGEPSWVAMAQCNRGILAHWQGDDARATALLGEALAANRELDDPWGIGIALSDLAFVTGERGDHGEAAAVHLESLARLRRVGSKEALADSVARIATLAMARGQADEAARLLGASAALAQAIGYAFERPEQARYDRAGAEARRALGEAAFTTAQAEGRSLPLADAVAAAEAVANAIAGAVVGGPAASTRHPSPDAASPPHGLTRRELEVLRLLVDGRTDREIAEQLFISRRTASKHVEAILTKLGVPSRGAAAAEARRRGLV